MIQSVCMSILENVSDTEQARLHIGSSQLALLAVHRKLC